MTLIVLIVALVAGVAGYLYVERRTGAGGNGRRSARQDSNGAGGDNPGGAAPDWERSLAEIRELPRGALSPSRGLGYWFEVVSDSYHQATLRAADGGRLDARRPADVSCLIVPEPQNPYDKNTIAVYVEGFGRAGRFSRQDAQAYQSLARLLLERGEAGSCRGELVARDRAQLALFLDLEEPAEPAGDGSAPGAARRPNDAVYASGWESRPRLAIPPGRGFGLAVSESRRFQAALRTLDAGRLARGETVAFVALLAPEPEHPGRPKSVLVCAEGVGPIGRLSKAACERYAGLATALESARRVGECQAVLVSVRGSLAARISLEPPPEAAARVWGV